MMRIGFNPYRNDNTSFGMKKDLKGLPVDPMAVGNRIDFKKGKKRVDVHYLLDTGMDQVETIKSNGKKS